MRILMNRALPTLALLLLGGLSGLAAPAHAGEADADWAATLERIAGSVVAIQIDMRAPLIPSATSRRRPPASWSMPSAA